MFSQFPLISTFVLGALHSLEPGHGKSIVAVHKVQSHSWSDDVSLLASLILTHFLLVVVISGIIYIHPEWLNISWMQYVAPIIVIFYGFFLLIKHRNHGHEYLGCSCSEEPKVESKKNVIWVGIMAGLTPCPSVLAPIVICMSNQQYDAIFYYLLAYILGVISVFVGLLVFVHFLQKTEIGKIEKRITKFNPHLISGIIMITIGIVYLAYNLYVGHE